MINFDDLNKPTENWFSISVIAFFTVLLLFATFGVHQFWWGGIATGVTGEVMGAGFLWASGRVWNTNRVLRWWMVLAGAVNLIAPWTQFLAWLGDHTILK